MLTRLKKGDTRQNRSTMFYPIDGRPTMSFAWLSQHKEKPKSTNQYVDNEKWKKPTAVRK